MLIGPVYEPMLIVDAPRPVPRQTAPECFWLSNSGERVALDLAHQPGDAPRRFQVGGQPEQKILPGVSIEVDIPHPWPPAISRSSSIVFVVALSDTAGRALSRATACIRRRAFSGERSRYTVSCHAS